jgi:hypothetical protein
MNRASQLKLNSNSIVDLIKNIFEPAVPYVRDYYHRLLCQPIVIGSLVMKECNWAFSASHFMFMHSFMLSSRSFPAGGGTQDDKSKWVLREKFEESFQIQMAFYAKNQVRLRRMTAQGRCISCFEFNIHHSPFK